MYFETAGKSNTEQTVAIAKRVATERGIRHIVIASNTGNTARLLIGAEVNVVCVTHVQGFVDAGANEMTDATRQELTAAGIKVLTTSHVFSGAERGLSSKFGGAGPVEIIAHTLRMFGQGTKVSVEISVMALDAGLIPYGEPVLAIAGSGRGSDTALILRPAHASRILETKILEVVCKPALW